MEKFTGAKIKVIGAGGGGGNAVSHMVEQGVTGVDYAIVNTDYQALEESVVEEKIQIGKKLTEGLGAGANPEVGRKAAEENIDEIEEMIDGNNLIFITAGLGGGSGTGSAPVIAEVARKKGCLTVGVVTLPFGFEGRSRMRRAMAGKKELSKHVDTIITIPNDRLTGHVESLGKKFNVQKAFEEVNNVLLQAVTGITDLITKPGVINLDFADIRTVMSIRGASLMGMGAGVGEDRVREATEKAIKNPLLTHDITGAKGVLFNITGNKNLDYSDFILASDIIESKVSEDAEEIIIGTVLDETIPEDTVYVTVVATGFDDMDSEEVLKNTKQNQPTKQKQTPHVHTRRAVEFQREAEQEVVQEQDDMTTDEEQYVTKELKSIYESVGLEMPAFMNKRNRG